MAAATEATSPVGEKSSELPSSDDVAQRGRLRGLGKELVRLDADKHHALQLKCGRREPYRCSWWGHPLFRSFLPTTDPGLHGILAPYADATLLETHGEQFLEIFITKAPEEVWREWLFGSLNVAVFADRVGVFGRLFALCENNPELRNHPRIISLLPLAAMNGRIGVLSTLLGMDDYATAVQELSDVQHGGASALTWAALSGHRSCVAALVKVGAPLEYKWNMGGTALMEAVERGHEGVVLELLAGGADVNSVNDDVLAKVCSLAYPNYSPLGIAVAVDNMAMVDILLAAGAGFGKDRVEAHPPVIVAAYWGRCGPLERLLEAGADVNVVNIVGESALHNACYNSQEGAVEVLLRHNASPSMLCDKGLSPADVVAVAALEMRQRRRCSPTTLGVAETAAAETIHDMLRQAGAWARRGWLVMLRARRVAADQLLEGADTSFTNPSPIDQVEGRQDAGNYLGIVGALEAVRLADPSSTSSRSRGELDREKNVSPARTVSEGDAGDDDGRMIGASDGWSHAVEWLLQCPDDCGVFLKIVHFL